VYHVLNRAVARLALFEKEADYAAFERVLAEALQEHPTRLLSYAVMPNHWHLVLWPRHDGELTDFVRWLTHTHVMRWHAHFGTSGSGHLYQGRFKSFPVEADDHFYTVVRYVERNALRARLVSRAEQWRWSSLWQREFGTEDCPDFCEVGGAKMGLSPSPLLHRWPLAMPADWVRYVNRPQTEAELKAVRHAIRRSSPFGSSQWQVRTANRLGLEWTLRPRGRPRKQK
jgi:putative transposase